MKKILLASFCALLPQAALANPYDFTVQLTASPERIAFGSCNDLAEDSEQKFWDEIRKVQPQAWIWNGDIVYPDNDPAFIAALSRWEKNQDAQALLEMESIRRRHFQQLKDNAHYRQLRQGTAVFGAWDDHDYGFNNADGSYAGKEQSKETLLNFLDVAPNHDLWSRAGIYHSVVLNHGQQSLHLIVLDLRYEADFAGGRLLSADQWTWLEAQFANSDADAVILFSALTVEKDVPPKDNWHDFNEERLRLRKLILDHPQPVAVVSGDLHYAGFSRIGGSKNEPRSMEFTSSGMTHTKDFFTIAYWTLSQLFGGKKVDKKLAKKNFGEIVFHWDESQSRIKNMAFHIRSIKDGKILRKKQWQTRH